MLFDVEKKCTRGTVEHSTPVGLTNAKGQTVRGRKPIEEVFRVENELLVDILTRSTAVEYVRDETQVTVAEKVEQTK